MSVNITLPKLFSNTKPYANALKLSIAASVKGSKVAETAGDAVALVASPEVSLTDANAAVK
jgi:methionyl-tRNA synthetase